MLKKFSVIAAAAVATLAVAACGTTEIDLTAATEKEAQAITAVWQAYYAEQGITSAEAASAGVTFTCPDSVAEGETFSCTIKGTNSGESVDVQMTVNDATKLVPVDKKAFDAAIAQMDAAEGATVEAG
ncbi:MAG: hypothetical protein JHD03_09430 [Solirubrobacteraceae bacterium]|nr:hypothetical protein [Solirubrobacteraceae bacterium]